MINRGGRRVKLVHPTETTIHINTAIRARLKEREKGLRNRISREEETTPFLRSLPSLFRITELREKKRKERKKRRGRVAFQLRGAACSGELLSKSGGIIADNERTLLGQGRGVGRRNRRVLFSSLSPTHLRRTISCNYRETYERETTSWQESGEEGKQRRE